MSEIALVDLKQTIKSRWRVQRYSRKKPVAICIPYIDSRDVQNRLDDVCGPENWQDDYKVIKDNLYAGIGIRINEVWIWKWDCGTESEVDKEKGEASDSFKRAGVKWGIGRYLYEMEVFTVRASEVKNDSNKPFPVDEQQKRIYDLTEYINKQRDSYPLWWNQAVEYIRNGGDIDQIKKKHGTLVNWNKLESELKKIN